MQHRSLTGTREWRPNTPASPKSPVRYHSPYCEATGPIVQDGFVAFRIRTLQALSNHDFKPIRSHSPMLDCPRPWQHNHEHHIPPTPESSAKSGMKGHDGPTSATNKDDHGSASLNRSQEQCNKSSVQMMGLLDAVPAQRLIDLRLQGHEDQSHIELPESSTTRSPHSDDVAIDDSTTVGRQTPSEDGILSPRAIPVSLADPSKVWRDISQTGSYDHDNCHNRNLRPRRSIADRLGSMVERGWVGCDVFSKAHNSREASESIVGKSTHDERVKRRSRSLEQHQQRTRPLSLKRHRSLCHNRVAANTQESGVERISDQSSNNHYPRGKYSPPAPVQDAVRGIHIGKRSAQRSISNAELYREENCASSSSGRHRVWPIRHLSRLQRSQSQQFELETISSGHGSRQGHGKQDRKTINHFLSSGNRKGEQKHEPEALLDDQLDQELETASLTPDSSRASINTTHSARSATRSGSWFKKYRFLPKLVPAEISPALWDFSNEDQSGSAAIGANGDCQQDFLLQSDQHYVGDSRSSGSTKHGFGEANGETDATLMELGTTTGAENMPQDVSPRTIELRMTTSPQGSESSLVSEQMKSLIKPVPTSCPLFADAESPVKEQERNPPKQADYFSEHREHPFTSPSPTQARHSSMSRGTDATLATVVSCKSNGVEITRRSPMNSPASKHSADPVEPNSQVDEATQTVGQTLGKGRKVSEKKIKKIQVTITLDGAEELVIEAKLQRRAGWEGWGMSSE